jgi:hypothetical protein
MNKHTIDVLFSTLFLNHIIINRFQVSIFDSWFHFHQRGRTAMSRARANGHSAIVDWLTASGAVIVDDEDDDEDDDA